MVLSHLVTLSFFNVVELNGNMWSVCFVYGDPRVEVRPQVWFWLIIFMIFLCVVILTN